MIFSDPGRHTAAEWKSSSPVVKLQRGSNYLWTIDLSSFRMLTDQCVSQWVRETAGRSRAHLREANASFVWTVNGPKCSLSIKRSQLPSVTHLIIQTAEFWRASTGRKQRAAFLTTGACTAESDVGLALALLLCALSPILISWGGSWRRTAATCRLFIQRLSPLCLPASATNSQMQEDRLSEHLDSLEQVLLLFSLVYF